MNEPWPLALTKVLERPETARLVVVAAVVVAFVAVKFWRVVEPETRKDELTVEEALEKKPPKRPRMVEVAWSPLPCLVKGQAKLVPPDWSVAQSQLLAPVFFKISPSAQVRPSGRSSPLKLRLPPAKRLPVEEAWPEKVASTKSPKREVILPMIPVLALRLVLEARLET